MLKEEHGHIRGQTLMEMKAVCLFLQCYFKVCIQAAWFLQYFFHPLAAQGRLCQKLGWPGKLCCNDLQTFQMWGSCLSHAESGGDMNHTMRLRDLQSQGELSVYHAALTRSKGNSWRKRRDPTANRNVSFPTFPNCVIPNSSACCLSIPGPGAGASQTKAT